MPIDKRDYKTKRFKLWFSKTALFYFNYNLRLFFFLLFSKTDYLLANDLDTLPANYLASVIKRRTIIYDSHEYFTGVPELQERPLVRKTWETIEAFIFPRLSYIYTVNDSIAKIYNKRYGKQVKVVRNMPFYVAPAIPKEIWGEKKILIYQGSGINVNRGAEELVLAMEYLDPQAYNLWMIGGGDVYQQLVDLAQTRGLTDRIHFTGKIPFAKLSELTRKGHLGLSLDKNSNINYALSLPNKIFDYVHAGLPLLTSYLPEIVKIIETYELGQYIQRHDPRHIADRILFMFGDEKRYNTWRHNTLKAARILCWQEEEKVILNIFAEIQSKEK